MPTEHDEQAALVQRIIQTALKQSPARVELLKYLLAHLGTPVKSSVIAKELLNNENQDYVIRARAIELKGDLDIYAKSKDGRQQKWLCSLPGGTPDGYQLDLIEQGQPFGTTGLFWNAHLRASNVIVLLTEHLYYPTDVIYPLPQLKPTVPPLEAYIPSGHVIAGDHIQEWFRSMAATNVKKTISRFTADHELLRSSPVIFNQHRGQQFSKHPFSYRISSNDAVHIHEPTQQEIEALARFRGEWKSPKIYQLFENYTSTSFVVVSRLQNSFADGVITIIASNHTMTPGAVGEILTNEKDLQAEFVKTSWPNDKPLPLDFQWLFYVAIAPSGITDALGKPELIAWRPLQW